MTFATRCLQAAFLLVFSIGTSARAQDVVIHEIAWMGTTYAVTDEWIELYNPTGGSVSLAGWTLAAADGTPSILLTGSVPPGGFYLLERSDDASVPDLPADQIYTGALENGGEVLELRDAGAVLVDQVDAWHAGDNPTKATMARIDSAAPGTDPANWETSTCPYNGGLGTPAAPNRCYIEQLSVYFSDHLNTTIPGDSGPKAMGAALIDAIDTAADSIDFALYGVDGSQAVIDALLAAVDRGVLVRGVVDSWASGCYPYGKTLALAEALPAGAVVADRHDDIMHNKFFVFDGRWVWTGSANVSDTGLYLEYNSNVSILIDHPGLAQAYTTEFEEMFGGSFHNDKSDNTPHVFPPLADGTVIESYFGPTDDAETNAIVRLIDEALATLDVRMFYFTDYDIRDAILAAHQRGAAVRMIIDASAAANEYSQHQALRDAGIPVKVEDWGGKEHMKAAVADGIAVVLGSQNWTGSGNTESDENTLYIKNSVLAESFTDDFELHWAAIPNTWASGNPGAESIHSTGSLADFIDNDHDGLTDEGAAEQLNSIESGPGAINVYFNKAAWTAASQGSPANHRVNLEQRLLARLGAAVDAIDMATYELNLPAIVDALLERAVAGVEVRVIADAKDHDTGEDARYDLFCLNMEKLRRGSDGVLGSGDEVAIFADSPMFAVTDAGQRAALGLPASYADLSYETLTIGTRQISGWVLTYGELENATDYYSRGPQMHNKFVVIDGTWVWTGSWNFTITGLYGSEDNMAEGLLGGNSNHGIELYSTTLAAAYTTEFEEMWGSSTMLPDPEVAAFHGRKIDNTPHQLTVGGRDVEIYFSPSDDAIGHMTQYVADHADESALFSIFAWSDQALVDTLKVKYEGSAVDLEGTLTGFTVEGVFDSAFWNQWWSASVDMTGRTASQTSTNNPNTRWANPAPVRKDHEDAKLHHKTMIIDGHSASSPAVITGSANWSANGNDKNDENLLILHDAAFADQFVQEFEARYHQAGDGVYCAEPAVPVFADGFESGDVTAWSSSAP